jgi:hypothetical protein
LPANTHFDHDLAVKWAYRLPYQRYLLQPLLKGVVIQASASLVGN